MKNRVQVCCPLSVLGFAACGNTEPSRGQSFVFGWVLLGILAVFMLLLFAGLIRYVRAGNRKKREQQQQPPNPTEFQYDKSEEEEN